MNLQPDHDQTAEDSTLNVEGLQVSSPKVGETSESYAVTPPPAPDNQSNKFDSDADSTVSESSNSSDFVGAIAEDDSNDDIIESEKPIISFFSVFLMLVILTLCGFAGYWQWQSGVLEDEVNELEDRIAVINSQAGQTESQVTPATKRNFLAKVNSERTLWTNVINDLFSTVPKNVDGERTVVVQSINGSEGGQLSIALNSADTTVDPYIDAALFYQALVENPNFVRVFIPSLSSNITQTGQERLRYSLILKHDATATELIDATDLVELETPDSSSVPVLTESAENEDLLEAVSEALRSRTEADLDSTEPLTPETDE